MKRNEILESIVDYVQSNGYLCDLHNDYAQASQEMCKYDYESLEDYINRRCRSYAQQEARRQGYHFTDEELDFYFPTSYPTMSYPKFSILSTDVEQEDDDLPF